MLLILLVILLSIMTACNKKEDAIPVDVEIETEQQETGQASVKKETTDNSFPVQIHHNGEKVRITDLPEASQAALWWAYDFFNTEEIETEEEFYEFMKEKYYIERYENGMIPEDIDAPKYLFGGYGSDMLPEFISNRKVESIVVNIEVPEGGVMTVPMYLKFKNQENMHAVAISYSMTNKVIYGADTKFPMAYH